MTAAVVVVTNRGPDAMVHACLASVAAATVLPVAVVVVDNSDARLVGPDAYGPGVDDVVRTENLGFGAAANTGVRRARELTDADSPVVVLNDDLEVDPGWLGPLVAALDADDRLGAVQPALLRHGTDRINSLGVELDRYGAGSDIGLDEPAASLGDSRPIEIFTGGAVLFRREFLDDTGGFDERYFLYYEDVDLALRGAERGWRYVCETSSVVRHHGGATTDRLGAQRVAYQERNRLWAAARFGSPALLGRALGLSIRRLRHGPRAAHAKALATGLAGMPGALIRRLRQPA
ncbi:glycosyltransferase [Ilumatobacter nonamiensis]|uniref:glycosyltransferase n=1 Tax=Ilumatobacter nonamiensis TaxID=467093 RepID=UPI000345EC04|nr:glycosyltransferase family 2 protein [Ilumatobacter nonamiensis]